MSDISIGAYALLFECHSSALVDAEGSVERLAFPRFDSPSVRARLFDDGAGHWAIRPVAVFTSIRRYVDPTWCSSHPVDANGPVPFGPQPSPRTGGVTPPQEVAGLVALLASRRAGKVTGAGFVIDGRPRSDAVTALAPTARGKEARCHDPKRQRSSDGRRDPACTC